MACEPASYCSLAPQFEQGNDCPDSAGWVGGWFTAAEYIELAAVSSPARYCRLRADEVRRGRGVPSAGESLLVIGGGGVLPGRGGGALLVERVGMGVTERPGGGVT